MGGLIAFIMLSINPFGGLLVSIPLAVFKLHYPAWVAVVGGVPLAYVQVLFVDLAWDGLNRWDGFRSYLERKRSPRAEKLMASGGAFVPTMLFAPLIGPWVVMAFMRYARVPQRKVALPILLGLTWIATLITGACVYAPQWFTK